MSSGFKTFWIAATTLKPVYPVLTHTPLPITSADSSSRREANFVNDRTPLLTDKKESKTPPPRRTLQKAEEHACSDSFVIIHLGLFLFFITGILLKL